MKSIILLFVFYFICFSEAVELLSLNYNPNFINFSTPLLTPSTTIQFTLNVTNPETVIVGGQFVMYDIGNTFPFTVGQNLVSRQDSASTFQLCIPSQNFIELCGADPLTSTEVRCQVTLSVLFKNGDNTTFSDSQILKMFPNSTLTIAVNKIPPKLTGIKVYQNSLNDNFVSIEFSVEWYGAGMNGISIIVLNSTNGFGISSASNQLATNGKYYFDQYVSQFQSGSTFYFSTIVLLDAEDNSVEYEQKQIAKIFGQKNFTIPYSSTNSQLYNVISQNKNHISGISYDPVIFNIETFTSISISSTPLNIVPCYSYFVNTSYVNQYCYTPTYMPVQSFATIMLVGTNGQQNQDTTINVPYSSPSSKSIKITNTSFLLDSIDQLYPLMFEVNVTFESVIPVGEILFIETDNNACSNTFSYNSLVSGTRFNGTYNLGFYFDSSVCSLRILEFLVYFANSNYELLNDNGIPTTKRSVFPDIEIQVEYLETNVTFGDNGFVMLPLLVSASSNNDDYIESSFFYIVESGMQVGPILQSNSLNYLSSRQLYSNTTYSLFPNYIGLGFSGYPRMQPGDFIFGLQYVHSGIVDNIYLNKECFSYNPVISVDGVQLTNFDVYPTVFNLSSDPFIIFNITFKGAFIQAVNVSWYSANTNVAINYPCDSFVYYDPSTLSSSFECSVEFNLSPSTFLNLYLSLLVDGEWVTYYNGQLQSEGFTSYIEVTGFQDNGYLPTLTNFSTQINESSNEINMYYNIENSSPYSISVIEIIIYDRDYPSITTVYPVYDYNGTFTLDLSSVGYYNMNIGTAVRIICFGFYNFDYPYEILYQMDSNHLNFTFDSSKVDYQPPRLVDISIIDYQPFYYTDNNGTVIPILFTITDDISGFEMLYFTIASINNQDYYIYNFVLTKMNLFEGNYNNGQYLFNFIIPQYTNGAFSISVSSLYDQVGHVRTLLPENSVVVSTNNVIYATSSIPNPSIPSFGSIYIGNEYLYVEISGNVLNVYLLGNDDEIFYLSPNNNETFQISFPPTIPSLNGLSGTYYFSICLTSKSFSTQCLSWAQLQQQNLPYYFVVSSNTSSQ